MRAAGGVQGPWGLGLGQQPTRAPPVGPLLPWRSPRRLRALVDRGALTLGFWEEARMACALQATAEQTVAAMACGFGAAARLRARRRVRGAVAGRVKPISDARPVYQHGPAGGVCRAARCGRMKGDPLFQEAGQALSASTHVTSVRFGAGPGPGGGRECKHRRCRPSTCCTSRLWGLV